MGNGERSGSGDRNNWPVRLSGMVGGGAGIALAMLVGSLADLHSFRLGMIMVCVGAGVGVARGQLVGSLVFRRPPGDGPRANPSAKLAGGLNGRAGPNRLSR